MDASDLIHTALAHVFELRDMARSNPRLGSAVSSIKRLQAERFRTTYADLLASSEFGEACRFFLEELYSDADYADRDRQFARIANTLATVLPDSVLGTSVELAQLHALTEDLDHAMAQQWLRASSRIGISEGERYRQAWRSVDRRAERMHQLQSVLAIGQQLGVLTQKRGLLTLLKVMRRPASAAGLTSLQQFLERGFSVFSRMALSKGKVAEFLGLIQSRESAWIADMFDTP